MIIAKQQVLQTPSNGSNSGNIKIINSARRGDTTKQLRGCGSNCAEVMFGGSARRLRQTSYDNASTARHGGGDRLNTVKLGGAAQRQRQTGNNSTWRHGTVAAADRSRKCSAAQHAGGGRPLTIVRCGAARRRRTLFFSPALRESFTRTEQTPTITDAPSTQSRTGPATAPRRPG